MRLNSKLYSCPQCQSKKLIQVVYGYPDPELMEQIKRGEVTSGGCFVGEFSPNWHCKNCGLEFFKTRDKLVIPQTEPPPNDPSFSEENAEPIQPISKEKKKPKNLLLRIIRWFLIDRYING